MTAEGRQPLFPQRDEVILLRFGKLLLYDIRVVGKIVTMGRFYLKEIEVIGYFQEE